MSCNGIIIAKRWHDRPLHMEPRAGERKRQYCSDVTPLGQKRDSQSCVGAYVPSTFGSWLSAFSVGLQSRFGQLANLQRRRRPERRLLSCSGGAHIFTLAKGQPLAVSLGDSLLNSVLATLLEDLDPGFCIQEGPGNQLAID